MITLIAESKTMSSSLCNIAEAVFKSQSPVLENDADCLMDYLRTLPVEDISQLLKISPALAAKCYTLIYDFPNKSTGITALEAFTGEVFRAFDFKSLDGAEKTFARQHIGIVSSAYGLIFPENIIKPYRFDFNCKGAPGNNSLIEFWKEKVTAALIDRLKKTNEKEVINMLPADAAKFIDWKKITGYLRVSKPDFKTVAEDGSLKTPHSGKIKELRGQMLRYIVISGIDSLDEFENLKTANFAADKDLYETGNPTFISIGNK